MSSFRKTLLVSVALLALLPGLAWAAGAGYGDSDWPMWRRDELRGNTTPMSLPATLYLQWRRDVPAPRAAHTYPAYMALDLGYEPVVLGKTLFVGLNATDCLLAVDTDTGAERWRFYADAPIRLAPLAVNGKAYCISDDGVLYCLSASDGALAWKFSGAPRNRKIFGNQRLISNWPARGGLVYCDGIIYFTAGMFPQEGVFAYAVDAATGAEVWRNDSLSGVTSAMSHDNRIIAGGPTPHGYLTVSGDRGKLYLAVGKSPAAVLDRATGRLVTWSQGGRSSPGGWWINSSGATQGAPGAMATAGGTAYTAATVTALGVTGTVHSIIAADSKLFVTTRQGSIYCFGGTANGSPPVYLVPNTPLPSVSDSWTTAASQILSATGDTGGCCLALGIGSGRLVEEMVKQAPSMHVVAVDPNPAKVAALRLKMDAAGLYGRRCVAMVGNPLDCGLPPYVGRLIVSEDIAAAGFGSGQAFVEKMFYPIRPYGGAMWLPISADQHSALSGWVAAAGLTNAAVSREGSFSKLARVGALPGAVNYQGGSYTSIDAAAKAPLGMQWFDTDSYIAQSGIVDGKLGLSKDVYTGLTATYSTSPTYTTTNPAADAQTHSNPFYGVAETRKTGEMCYGGCGPPKNYGDMIARRSGSAAYYDLLTDSGMTHFTWGRTSCGSGQDLAPGNGVLVGRAANCGSCDWPLAASFGMVTRPEEESWAAWRSERSCRQVESEPVRRLGVNFGAPAERMDDGTLWIHRPRRSSVTPIFEVRVNGVDSRSVFLSAQDADFRNRSGARNYYHHASRIVGGDSKGWIAASGIVGARDIVIGLTPEAAVAKKTNSAPVLDGVLNDACWDGSAPLYMSDFIDYTTSYQNVGQVGASVHLRYDSNNLYVACKAPNPRGETNLSLASWTVCITDPTKLSRPVLLKVDTSGIRSARIPWATESWGGAWQSGSTCSASAGHTVEYAIPFGSLAAEGFDTGNLLFNVEFIGGWEASTATWLWGLSRLRSESGNGDFSKTLCPLAYDAAYGAMKDMRTYQVKLHFAETEGATAGQRVFHVKLQGQTVLSNFDVFSAAGGANIGLCKSFPGVQARDQLKVELVPVTGEPVISGIELVEMSSAPIAPTITSPLTASGTVGQTFSYTILATGTTPITFGATNLPAGLSFSGATIGGTPTAAGTTNVALTATNSVGSDNKTLAVTISPPANVPPTVSSFSPATPFTMAAGTSQAFSVDAYDADGDALSYLWKLDGAATGNTGASMTYSPTSANAGAHTIVCTVSDGRGGTVAQTWAVTVTVPATAPSIATQPANQTVTAGQTATFSVTALGTAPLSYQWRKNAVNIGGATSASYTTPATTTADSGSAFSVVVTNSAGSVTSNNATLTVNAAPVAPSITTQPASTTVAAGATATFTVVASGTAPLSYQWQKNGANIGGATSASYTTPATTSADNGSKFKVVVTNSAGSATSSEATLTVNTGDGPAGYTWCANEGDTYSLIGTCDVAYGANGSYNYLYGRTGNITFNNATFGDPIFGVVKKGYYKTVGSQPPSITTQPANATVTVGATATFTVVASGTAPLSYQWYKNGATISGATAASYTTPATTSADNGAKFRVVVTNSAGSTTSSEATLTVNSGSTPGLVTLRARDQNGADVAGAKVEVDIPWVATVGTYNPGSQVQLTVGSTYWFKGVALGVVGPSTSVTITGSMTEVIVPFWTATVRCRDQNGADVAGAKVRLQMPWSSNIGTYNPGDVVTLPRGCAPWAFALALGCEGPSRNATFDTGLTEVAPGFWKATCVAKDAAGNQVPGATIRLQKPWDAVIGTYAQGTAVVLPTGYTAWAFRVVGTATGASLSVTFVAPLAEINPPGP